MSWQPNLGDVPAWVALAASGFAIWQNRRSTKFAKQSAEAADRSADESARANSIAERALDFGKIRAAAADQPPDAVVELRIERGSGAEYLLRNYGTAVAERVEVDPARAPAIRRNLPASTVIGPGEAHRMLLKGSMQSRMPTQLYVRWSGQDDWVALPLPD